MSALTFTRLTVWVCATTAIVGCGGNTAIGTGPPINEPQNKLPYHHTFKYTGAEQSFKVPSGVTEILVIARGAAGNGGPRWLGRGGRVHAVISVKPDETLYVFVGGRGEGSYDGGNGFNGGGTGGSYPSCGKSDCYGYGGGGASDVREGGDSLADRILVAGGGGGEGTAGQTSYGGAGGGKVGGNGGGAYYKGMGGGGGGGGRTEGGSGGSGGRGIGSEPNGGPGSSGTLGNGGSGGAAGYNPYPSGDNEGGAGGGGGGGYYGGGGGGGGGAAYASIDGAPSGGGGGGSSYVEPGATKVQLWQGWSNANGLVVFSWK